MTESDAGDLIGGGCGLIAISLFIAQIRRLNTIKDKYC